MDTTFALAMYFLGCATFGCLVARAAWWVLVALAEREEPQHAKERP